MQQLRLVSEHIDPNPFFGVDANEHFPEIGEVEISADAPYCALTFSEREIYPDSDSDLTYIFVLNCLGGFSGVPTEFINIEGVAHNGSALSMHFSYPKPRTDDYKGFMGFLIKLDPAEAEETITELSVIRTLKRYYYPYWSYYDRI